MFKSYLKLALRNYFVNKFFTSINFFGLVAGLTSSLLILVFVTHEFNHDTFHKNYEQIFKIGGELAYGENIVKVSGLSAGFGPKLKAADSRIKEYVRFYEPGQVALKHHNEIFLEEQLLFTDPSFFDVFDFELERGSVEKFDQPGKVLLSTAAAEKYFGRFDVIGEVLQYDGSVDLEVVGVFDEYPSNSSFDFEMLSSFSTLLQLEKVKSFVQDEELRLGTFTTYLKASQQDAKDEIEQLIATLNSDESTTYYLTALSDLHFANNESSFRNVWIFLAIGVLVLLLALINYVNLTTARAVIRSKEVGIRKVIGAGTRSLSIQFFLESSVFIILAFILSVGVVYFSIPFISMFLDKDLAFSFLYSSDFIVAGAGVLLVSILLAGSYPALVLSRFKPVTILKGGLSGKGKGSWVQKSFASFQFAISLGLVLCTIVISEQLNHVKNYNLGFDKDEILVLTVSNKAQSGIQSFKNELRKLSGVKEVAQASMNMFKGGYSIYFTQKPGTNEDISLNYIAVDEKFVNTLELEWVERPQETLGNGGLIINEAALDALDDNKDPLSIEIALGNGSSRVRGVVKNFNYTSLKNKIGPLVMRVQGERDDLPFNGKSYLYLKLQAGANLSNLMSSVEDVNAAFDPNSPFDYYFLDDAFDKMYRSEVRLFSLFTAFSTLAVAIAIMGLFGIVTFSLERRYREIGIRKVFGANSNQLVRMIINEYLALFVVSILVSIPTAWWLMNQWLMSFTYRIEISLWFALTATVMVLLFGLLTLFVNTWKAALKDPVESLRYE